MYVAGSLHHLISIKGSGLVDPPGTPCTCLFERLIRLALVRPGSLYDLRRPSSTHRTLSLSISVKGQTVANNDRDSPLIGIKGSVGTSSYWP